MEQKEVKINIPEGYETDEQNSSFTCIKFKKKKTTYTDILNSLSKETCVSFIASINKDISEKLAAITKLTNTAWYLNKGWKPDFTNDREMKYSIFIIEGKIDVQLLYIMQTSMIYFKTRELANETIRILGEETIKAALS